LSRCSGSMNGPSILPYVRRCADHQDARSRMCLEGSCTYFHRRRPVRHCGSASVENHLFPSVDRFGSVACIHGYPGRGRLTPETNGRNPPETKVLNSSSLDRKIIHIVDNLLHSTSTMLMLLIKGWTEKDHECFPLPMVVCPNSLTKPGS